jgi:hypothetical protein
MGAAAQPSDSNLLISLLIPTIVAIIGWYIVHRLNIRQNRLEERREMSLRYIIDAYRFFTLSISEGVGKKPEDFHRLQSSLSDIHLFGSRKQIGLAKAFANEFSKARSAEIGTLVLQMRNDLRKELSLPKDDFGGFVVNWSVEGSREDESIRRTRLDHLISTYCILSRVPMEGVKSQEGYRDFCEAITDIWLFGTRDQVEMANAIAEEFHSHRTTNMDFLLADLKNDLRSELGLSREDCNFSKLRYGIEEFHL